MAGIDKTYTTSWNEYQKVKRWMDVNPFTCPNGTVVKGRCYNWSEEDFDGTPRPIINTSQELDYFLIKYCPLKIIQDRMMEVYSEDYIDSVFNGTSKFDTFKYPKVGTKVKLLKKVRHNKLYNSAQWLEVRYNDSLLWYAWECNKFILPGELFGSSTISSSKVLHCKTLKSLIRQIKKLKLPKGAIVSVTISYSKETFTFKIY